MEDDCLKWRWGVYLSWGIAVQPLHLWLREQRGRGGRKTAESQRTEPACLLWGNVFYMWQKSHVCTRKSQQYGFLSQSKRKKWLHQLSCKCGWGFSWGFFHEGRATGDWLVGAWERGTQFPQGDAHGRLANPKKAALNAQECLYGVSQHFHLWLLKQLSFGLFNFWVEILNLITCPQNVRWDGSVLL